MLLCCYLIVNSVLCGFYIKKKCVKSSLVRIMYLGIIKIKCLVYMNYGCVIKC